MKDFTSAKEILDKEGSDYRMAVSKDTEKGTWTSQIWVEDWQGKKNLLMIQEQTEERFDLLAEQMAKQEGVTEQLKAQDQMLWVRRMNCIRARAEEIVREEIIYCLWKCR